MSQLLDWVSATWCFGGCFSSLPSVCGQTIGRNWRSSCRGTNWPSYCARPVSGELATRSSEFVSLDFSIDSADREYIVRVAALYDIHGNLPALEAVLRDAGQLGVDHIVVGGDVLPGPMPLATLDCLRCLDVPVQFIYGNGELAVLAEAVATDDPSTVNYWGTVSGAPLPAPLRQLVRWTAQQLRSEDERLLSSWPKTLRLDVTGVGQVLFCHATPRNEVDCFTRLTPEDRLLSVFDELNADVVVCGHTHMQFDRVIGEVRVVNAGSVGMPFQQPAGAFWLLLDQDVQLRHTTYNVTAAAAEVRATKYPQAEEFAARYVLDPPPEAEMLDAFTALSFR